MKKLKLTLNKETIARLEDGKMDSVKGGTKVTYTNYPSCYPTCDIKCPELSELCPTKALSCADCETKVPTYCQQ
jgi:natural product precursor